MHPDPVLARLRAASAVGDEPSIDRVLAELEREGEGPAQLGRAWLARDAGRPDRVLQLVERLPGSAEAQRVEGRLLQAEALIELGRPGEALEACGPEPSGELAMLAARACVHLGLLDRGRQGLAAAAELEAPAREPGRFHTVPLLETPSALLARAELLERSGRQAEAGPLLLAAQQADPLATAPYRIFARLGHATGRPEAALRFLQVVELMPPLRRPELRIALAGLQIAGGDPTSARRVLGAMTQVPEEWVLPAATLWCELGEAEAIEGLEGEGDSRELLRGLAAQARGELGDAEEAFAAARDVAGPLPHTRLALLALDRGDVETASGALERARALAPHDPELRVAEAWLARACGRDDGKATAVLERAAAHRGLMPGLRRWAMRGLQASATGDP